MSSEFSINSIQSGSTQDARLEQLRKVSTALEASFLTEMLKHTGLNENNSSFSGGAGEAAFSSMLNQEIADALAKKGGVGLAEQIFNSLTHAGSRRV